MDDITRDESVALTDAYDGWAVERSERGNHEVSAFRAGWAAGRKYEHRMSAAPDLLSALTDLLIDGHIDICPASFKRSPHECLSICRAAGSAFDKATGKEAADVAGE